MINSVNVRLDQEWVELIQEAKDMGMTLEEVRALFQEKGIKNFFLHTEKEIRV
ncbi:anti-repressor SinI family protein [Ornithinibacillus salinisoli]|uniref:Anti-repressor SinI family protein n=1 Tax=Ornithinibacillus salinisoli TaxID=1848459 RepID=A0ABW4VXI6_9BACI